MSDAPRPVEVRFDRDNGRLVIHWDDAVQLQYPLDDLHNACPCAACRGHPGETVEPPSLTGAVLERIEEVGNYALRFRWQPPGCNLGIYTWQYLRKIGQPMPA
jgi:DUF971 family protein